MTAEQAINELKDWQTAFSHMAHMDKDMSYTIEALRMAIEALQRGLENVNADSCSEKPNRSDDYVTIKRQFVLDAINIGLSGYISDDDKMTLEGMGIAVSEIPSAQPERKKGEWIETEFLKLRECSCCHVRWGMYDVENFNFCPNCGADMRGDNND